MLRKLLFILFATISLNASAQKAVEFVQNKGQWTEDFAYKGMTQNGDIYLRQAGYTINLASHQNHDLVHAFKHGEITKAPTLKYHAYTVDFIGANKTHTFEGQKEQKHYYNYFLGNDSARWKSFIHPNLAVDYKNLYNGIDAHIYTDQNKLKYDLIVKPNANATGIRMKYEGVDYLKIKEGNLIIGTSLGDMSELKPYAYQVIDGQRQKVDCDYKVAGDIVSFDFPNGYDKKITLIIDPVLVFCSFSGSTGDNWGTTATYDKSGNYYGGGFNLATGFPTTVGAYDATFNGGGTSGGGQPQDVSILKFNPTGTGLIYATYIGGTDNEQPHSLMVDSTTGNLVIAGRTYSTNFPTSFGCFDPSHNGNADIFVFVLDNTGGNMVGSTFIGGNGMDGVNIDPAYTTLTGLKHNYGDDARSEVIVDNAGNIFVSAMTLSTNFPVTANAMQSSLGGNQDGVIFQLSPTCNTLMWSTYVGGTADDACYVLSFDKTSPNVLYVAGGTASANFPTTSGTLHSTIQGGIDGFLMRFNATTKALVASTFIGTISYDQIYGVQTDDSNHVFIMGQTQGNYPTTSGVYSNPNSPQFITKLNSNLSSILISTVFGSGSLSTTNISPTAFLVDRCGNIYVSGWGGPTGGNPGSTVGLPITTTATGFVQTTTDGSDFYYFVVDRFMQNLVYATYFGLISTSPGLGGEHVDGGTSRFDPNGVIYQAICAACGNTPGFPTTSGAYAMTNGSPNCNLGAVKIDFQLQDPDADANAGGNNTGCAPHTVNFINNSSSATGYIWDFGDGSSNSTQVNPSHTYTTPGTYTARLIANNPSGCTISSDTDFIQIIVLTDSLMADFNFVKVDSCDPFSLSLTNTTTYNNGPTNPNAVFKWSFGDGTTFTGANPPLKMYSAPQSYTIKLVVTDTTACNSPDSISKVVDFSTSAVLAGFNCPDSVCLPAVVNFFDASTNATGYAWTFGDGGTATVANPTHEFKTFGKYTVKLVVTNPTSCNKIDSFSRQIEVFESPIADFSYSPNPPTPNTPIQFSNNSRGARYYKWDFGDGTTTDAEDPTHTYQKNGLYVVCLTATNDLGCPDTICKPVRGNVIPLVDVPSGFSPNGDGANDILNVLGYGIETMSFKIYNRWGQLVFETNDRFKGWDGTFKGEPQEVEVYGYLLDVQFFDGSSTLKKGNITLLR